MISSDTVQIIKVANNKNVAEYLNTFCAFYVHQLTDNQRRYSVRESPVIFNIIFNIQYLNCNLTLILFGE